MTSANMHARRDVRSLPTKISSKTRPIDFFWKKSVEINRLDKTQKVQIENFYPFLNLNGLVYLKALIKLECRLQDIKTEVTKRSQPNDEGNWCKELLEGGVRLLSSQLKPTATRTNRNLQSLQVKAGARFA